MSSKHINITDYSTQIPGTLEDNQWIFPSITSTNSKDKQIYWQIVVSAVNNNGEKLNLADYLDNKKTQNVWGYIMVNSKLMGGKTRDSSPTIVKFGKNIGKKTETNPVCQALRDALGLYNKQLKKSNTTTTSGRTRYPPMLAQVLSDLNDLNFNNPIYVQKKYDGVRAVAMKDNTTVLYSRKCLSYLGFQYIKSELDQVFVDYPELYLDGELYKHGLSLQLISGYSRREDQPQDIKIQYYVYDCFIGGDNQTMKFSDRYDILKKIFKSYKFEYTVLVDTHKVNNKQEIMSLYNQFIGEKYEGAMIRLDEPYRYSYNDYHCGQLLKLKPTYDGEYEIVNWTTGNKGKTLGALIIICKTSQGKIFNINPAMEIQERIALANKMKTIEHNGSTHFDNQWKGKRLIIQYDDISNDGVPLRARTKMIIRTWD